jgi:general secretion pathway protein A
MYQRFFGLQKPPFSLTPDPEFLYLTPQYQEALAGLTYSIMARKGFVVLAGNAGTGKTTLLTRIMQHLPADRVQSSVILNPTLTPEEFLEATMLDFGFKDIPASKPLRIAALQSFLWKGNREGKISALIVDEAHKLSPELFEEIRLLGNLESASEKLLQIALVGQSELDDLLNGERLTAFKQRIAWRFSLQPLSGKDVESYIGYRWMKAGGSTPRFTAEAVSMISQVSQGIPRVINVICDNALMEAFGEVSAAVEARHVISVCHDLHLIREDRLAAVLTAEVMAPVPPVDGYSMKTLERYALSESKPSLLAKFASKLGLVRRVETT